MAGNYYFNLFFKFVENPWFFSLSLPGNGAFSEKNVGFSKFVPSRSPYITFSKSNKKNGALGMSDFGNFGRFLSFIISKLNIASNLEKGSVDSFIKLSSLFSTSALFCKLSTYLNLSCMSFEVKSPVSFAWGS